MFLHETAKMKQMKQKKYQKVPKSTKKYQKVQINNKFHNQYNALYIKSAFSFCSS
jgi:hypothetical protein